MSRRAVGLIVAAIGAAGLIISAAADLVGISSGGSAEMFGNRQIVGTVLGAIVLAAGLLIAFLPSTPTGRSRKAKSQPTQPVKHRRKR